MKALVTGVCGQDGWYLSEVLLERGYEVVGLRRGDEREAYPGVRVIYGDINDAACMRAICEAHRPDEVYNLAAVTHVGDSFAAPSVAIHTNAVGAENVMAAAYGVGSKIYQASTSELFGDSPAPQDERTPMHPRSPYAVGKLAAYWSARNYRQRGAHATNGILFNHESQRRGIGFVTQKIAYGVARILAGQADHLALGNIDAMRDWGHARDYCRAMWMMMQAAPGDYVVATGVTRTVREFCDAAFRHVGLDYREFVRCDPAFYRPLEVNKLCGDASKMAAIGWKPEITFERLVREMVDSAVRATPKRKMAA